MALLFTHLNLFMAAAFSCSPACTPFERSRERHPSPSIGCAQAGEALLLWWTLGWAFGESSWQGWWMKLMLEIKDMLELRTLRTEGDDSKRDLLPVRAKHKVIHLLSKDLKSSWGKWGLNSDHNLIVFGHPCPKPLLQRAPEIAKIFNKWGSV